jgi:hypothetical protein
VASRRPGAASMDDTNAPADLRSMPKRWVIKLQPLFDPRLVEEGLLRSEVATPRCQEAGLVGSVFRAALSQCMRLSLWRAANVAIASSAE